MHNSVGNNQVSDRVAAHVANIQQHCLNMRRNIIRMLARARSGHMAGSLDLVEVLACLFFDQMNYNPANPSDDNRDILVLSNGHTCPVLYAALAEAKLIPENELMTLRKFGSRLQGHPERTKLPWLETTSGPLGEGLSQAAGMAYYLRNLTTTNRRHVFCILGDGELNEGNVWEATMFASKYHLANLVAIVDLNRIQLSGRTRDIMPMKAMSAMWESKGWTVFKAFDGNDVAELLQVFSDVRQSTSGKPKVILAYTTPGKGVSFAENDYRWHGKAPSAGEAEQALFELEGE